MTTKQFERLVIGVISFIIVSYISFYNGKKQGAELLYRGEMQCIEYNDKQVDCTILIK